MLTFWMATLSDSPPQSPTSRPAPLTAVLIVRQGGRYSVSFHDEIVVRDNRDPEFALSREFVRRGLTGSVKIVDASGKHRSTIPDIERASRLCTREGPLRFFAYESRPERSPAPEDGEGGA